MKICFLSSLHPAFDKRVFDKEARTLAAAGYKVAHICAADSSTPIYACPVAFGDTGIYDGVEIIPYPKPRGLKARIRQIFQLYRMAKRVDADVYHCNEVDSWGIGVLLKILAGKRCVFDVHEHYPSTFAESRFPLWAQPAVATAVRILFRLLTPFTDRLVLAKSSAADDFKCAPEKKVLVRNFTPLSATRFAPAERALRKPGDPLKLVHLGIFSRLRGWPQVLEALSLAKHKQIELQVIGQFNDSSAADFQNTVKRLGLTDKVTVKEWMDFESAFRILCEADVGVIAFQPGIQNHVFAMPHKMFDYMAAGCAVLCPDFAEEVAPIVRETGCGLLIKPENPKDIAEKLDQMASEPSALAAMGKRGMQAVKDRYNWETEAAKLLAMYKELA